MQQENELIPGQSNQVTFFKYINKFEIFHLNYFFIPRGCNKVLKSSLLSRIMAESSNILFKRTYTNWL